MAFPETSSGVMHITAPDICGLWEVIKIREGVNQVSYPWLGDRYKYSFLEEMIFLCLKEGQTTHGSWEISERIHHGRKQYYIILDDDTEFAIIDLNEDELMLSDQRHQYLLVRRL